MTKFIAIKLNYDDRNLAPESKYTVEPTAAEYEHFVERFHSRNQGGDGFHECLNFEKDQTAPVRFYLPPNSIPKDEDEDYVVFSFTYKSDPSKPSVVLGVHAASKLVSKEGVRRLGTRPIPGHGRLTFHMEADPDFVTQFSAPLPYSSDEGRYTPQAWMFGLRYIGPEHAANILNDALARAAANRNSGSASHRAFIENEIEVIERIVATYKLKNAPKQERGAMPPVHWRPDPDLGKRGEEFIYRQEQAYAKKYHLPQELVVWASRTNPGSQFDIQTVRLTEGARQTHFIEVKSTTIAGLTNIYISQREIDWLRTHSDASSLVILVFGPDAKPVQKIIFSGVEFLDRFELTPIQFRLNPKE